MAVLPDKKQLKDSLAGACRWLTQFSMNQTEDVSSEVNRYGYDFTSWKGAMREYYAGERRWEAYGPHWHTAQTVKALLLAHQVLGDGDLLSAARMGAEFILRERIHDRNDPDYGALLSYEGGAHGTLIAEVAGMVESMDGLFLLAERTGDRAYEEAAIACLTWVARRSYLPGQGLFLDNFHRATREVRAPQFQVDKGRIGRPLIDDGVFLTAYHRTGAPTFRSVFFETAERLLAEEHPAGNWIRFTPCHEGRGSIHPRHAFWWGRPTLMAWRESGEEKYLECAVRSGEWYRRAQRHDGGLFRATYLDFNTDSFGHATSGILSACCLWRDLIVAGKGDAFREPLRRAIAYAAALQFRETQDANLVGSVIEKVVPPNGTDRLPYVIRDLGTIFYVQALSMYFLDDLQ